jgi:predicted RND superfamily exporter protein
MSGEAAGMQSLGFIFIPALAILIVILVLMSKSWFEPLILLGNIGVAIALNMGTNAIFDSVSDITQSIAAILQLVLSMDYSIMLMNFYRQEKELAESKYEAMKVALKKAFVAISSSSLTTVAGMIMLVFMSFTIGREFRLGNRKRRIPQSAVRVYSHARVCPDGRYINLQDSEARVKF